MDRIRRIEVTEHSSAYTIRSGPERTWQLLSGQLLPRKWILAAAVLLMLLAFAIRIHHLTLDSFWIDELNTIWVSNADTDTILNVRDHPPLLYLLTRTSLELLGETEFGARMPSVLASLPAISLLIALGRGFKYPMAGILAAFLLALSPFHLRHSQEARHYAMFMSVSLATYLLLFLAMKKPELSRWIGYGLATTLNLYIHYGALVVLAVQAILIAGWSIGMAWQRKYRLLFQPASAALTVTLLYAIRVPQLRRAFGRTFAEGDNIRYYAQAGPHEWLNNLYPALSTNHTLLSPILLALGLAGLVVLIVRRRWWPLAFVVVGLFLPVVLIVVTSADRSADPRYLIHLLPLFLLLASIAFVEFLKWIGSIAGAFAGWAVLIIAVGLVLVASSQLIEAEYSYAIHDWRNIAEALNQTGKEGDVVVAMTLSLPNGYNVAGGSLDYYLVRGEKQFNLLQAGELTQEGSRELFDSTADDADVWGVVVYYGPAFITDIPPTVNREFQGSAHLLRYPATSTEPMAEVLTLYEQMLPLANHPFPHCMLKQDMAIIYQQMGDLLHASALMADSLRECPNAPNASLEARRPEIISSLERQVQANYEEAKGSGRLEVLRPLALALLLIEPANLEAAGYVKFADLLELFEDGTVHLESEAPEPARWATFNIPPSSGEGDVLFLHPPGRVEYELSLPGDPTLFRSRIGMVPDSWEWGGDGATFVVEVETEEDGVQELFRQHVSNEPVDRYWHPVEVPLGEYAGQDVTLILRTEPGSANDETGDWAIWDRPAVWWDMGAEVFGLLYH